MKYCTKCGQGNPDEAQVCTLCGESLSAEAAGHAAPPEAPDMPDTAAFPAAMAEAANAPAGEDAQGSNPSVLWLVLNILLLVFSCLIPSAALLALEGVIFSGMGVSAHNKGQYPRRDTLTTVGKVLFFTGLGLLFVFVVGIALLLILFTISLDAVGMSWQDYFRYLTDITRDIHDYIPR